MHEICVERYVQRNRDRWRVWCAGCGMLVDNLGCYGAEQLRKLLASSPCTPTDLDRALDRVDGNDEAVLADKRTHRPVVEEAVKSSTGGFDLDVSA